MQEFNIVKKGRDYFLAYKGPYHCRIVIDEYSKNLPLGVIKLHVEEVTDKYKHYSNEATFRLILPFKEQGAIGICTLSTGRRNAIVYKKCLCLGGKWEKAINQWVFSSSISDKVDELGSLLTSEKIYIEAIFRETVSLTGEELTLFGYPLVKSVNQEGLISYQQDVKLVDGDIAVIGWGKSKKTIVLAGTKIRLFIPKALLNESSFHENYMCIVDIEKKRRPRKSTKFSWEM